MSDPQIEYAEAAEHTPAGLTVAEHLELTRLLEQARGVACRLEDENAILIKALGADVEES